MAEIQGLFQLRQRLNNMSMIIKAQAARALYAEALIELDEAKRRTPVDSGALRESGKVSLPTIEDKTISVAMGFGGTEPSSRYAIFVHEDLDADHPNGGQAKYLESVILESAPYMAERVGRRLDLSKV